MFFMILIGTMNLSRTRDRGNFHCPTCGATEPYRLRARRTFLTIYFIPTVPVSAAEPFVQCDTCRSTFDINVLEMDGAAHREIRETRFRDEALRASILTVLMDGGISEDEIRCLLQVSDRVLGHPVDREELGALCSIMMSQKIKPADYALTSSRRWNAQQRRTALRAMFLAASAEGALGDSQVQLMAKLKDLFDLTDAEYEETIEQAVQTALV